MTLDPRLLTGLGCALSIFLSSTGSAIASAEGATYAVRATNGYIRALVPIVIAGVLAIYGIIISYLLISRMDDDMSAINGYKLLSAGLSVGLACLASGYGMSKFIQQLNNGIHSPPGWKPPTNERVEATPLIAGRQGVLDVYSDDLFRKTVLSLMYLEAIALYGLIVALLLIGPAPN
eukprot:CAMPEP_0172365296 /NCGR_PEP_ID=MMETSP1060-20121228/8375_1 /TAXON_ID=37318 /ORGANISM="Pseudo-nitzschia pungens, Strain cf. cingulata" /LENGTH=176 /DNA_ID=CAMNT_0013088519 /DNA_START=86 /DNA_END=616 /DNA_ORIENTATION=+